MTKHATLICEYMEIVYMLGNISVIRPLWRVVGGSDSTFDLDVPYALEPADVDRWVDLEGRIDVV